MGDNRAEIEISFQIYGEKYKHRWSINYWPDNESSMIDQRVEQWLYECWREAHVKYSLPAEVKKEGVTEE